jgi:predicted nucleic acid-binding protein
LATGGLRLLPVPRTAFHRAAEISRAYYDGLRAGDALHLAVAIEAGAEVLAGLDKTMNASACRHGLRLAISL